MRSGAPGFVCPADGGNAPDAAIRVFVSEAGRCNGTASDFGAECVSGELPEVTERAKGGPGDFGAVRGG